MLYAICLLTMFQFLICTRQIRFNPLEFINFLKSNNKLRIFIHMYQVYRVFKRYFPVIAFAFQVMTANHQSPLKHSCSSITITPGDYPYYKGLYLLLILI